MNNRILVLVGFFVALLVALARFLPPIVDQTHFVAAEAEVADGRFLSMPVQRRTTGLAGDDESSANRLK